MPSFALKKKLSMFFRTTRSHSVGVISGPWWGMHSFRRQPSGTAVFFFNDTATTEIYTLSLHDALPICFTEGRRRTLCAMTLNDEKTSPDSSSKRAARLRMIGVIVLLLGIGSAGLVYWLGTRSPDVMDDLSMVGFNKARTRQ